MTRPPRGVPRDEWLLAVMLAGDLLYGALPGSILVRGSDRSAAMNGFVFGVRDGFGDEGNPDAYAAGAALAMALEDS